LARHPFDEAGTIPRRQKGVQPAAFSAHSFQCSHLLQGL
jgi:hypothetical protein